MACLRKTRPVRTCIVGAPQAQVARPVGIVSAKEVLYWWRPPCSWGSPCRAVWAKHLPGPGQRLLAVSQSEESPGGTRRAKQ